MTPERQRRWELAIVAAALTLAAAALMVPKVTVQGIPLLPDGDEAMWVVSAEVAFTPDGGPVEVSLSVPSEARAGVEIVEERMVSSGYGTHFLDRDGDRRLVWTQRSPPSEDQHLYYSAVVARNGSASSEPTEVGAITPPILDRREQETVAHILQAARERSADDESLVREVIASMSEQDAALIDVLVDGDRNRAGAIIAVLKQAGIPAREASLVDLSKRERHGDFTPGLEVHLDGRWQPVDLGHGRVGLHEDHILWQTGGGSLLQVQGAEGAHASVTVLAHESPELARRSGGGEHEDQHPLAFTLFDLPVDEQHLFAKLMLIPIAALVVVLMRNVVGIVTSGTFMPVLLALVFIETGLVSGILLFLLIIVIGLLLRHYLSHLNLLLVPRIAAALVVVILSMLCLSLISWRMGLETGLQISLFPIIIIAWTIERLSVTIEEEDGLAACKETLGTLVVSLAVYLVMASEIISHLCFAFPELNLVVLAAILLLGTYSGYRLSELIRFRTFEESSS